MKQSDFLQKFIFEDANVRGNIVRISNTYKTILNQHPYPPIIKKLLGEALVSCILLTSSIKFEGEVTLQFHGDKRLPLLIVQCTDQLAVRACVKYQENLSNEKDFNSAFLEGKMVLTINQYNKTQAYQSVVPIKSTSMSENLMEYFAQSEQISTKVWFAVNEESAAGILLQLMPGENSIEKEQFWEYAVHIGQTITEDELLSLNNETILYRLYHEVKVRLFEPQGVNFSCKCTPEKMKQVLKVLGKEDLEKLLTEQEQIEVSCDFCNNKYFFDAIDVAMLFHNIK